MRARKVTDLIISNPKRNQAANGYGRASWYPYYAGFSPFFAEQLLHSAKLKRTACIVDPWNGGGTTTASAASLGYSSIGSDLNPVMVIAAKAYMLSKGDKESLIPLGYEICAKAQKYESINSIDPLLIWMSRENANCIRNIEHSIQSLLINGKVYLGFSIERIENLSDIASFFYVALFRAVKIILKKFYTSNPTWVKKPKEDIDKVNLNHDVIYEVFNNEIRLMYEYIGNKKFKRHIDVESKLLIASSDNLPIESNFASFILTSPPYCTRIDYAVATMVELAVLGMDFDEQFVNLRKSLIGTSTVDKVVSKPNYEWGIECNKFLFELENHTSKASNGYYKKNHVKYFESIFNSMKEIERILKKGGICSIVVQDSYYKDLHNNIQVIFKEMAEHFGLNMIRRDDFISKQNMANVNPEVKKYRSKIVATESVLFFEK